MGVDVAISWNLGGGGGQVVREDYDKLTDSNADGCQAMHYCMSVVYQNKKPEEASAPLELAATYNKDAVPGASNNWQRNLIAFDNMVLSSAAVSRLPSRRGGTIYISRLASNITVPTFCSNNIITPKCSCILENKVCCAQMSSMLPISLYVRKFRNFSWREW